LKPSKIAHSLYIYFVWITFLYRCEILYFWYRYLSMVMGYYNGLRVILYHISIQLFTSDIRVVFETILNVLYCVCVGSAGYCNQFWNNLICHRFFIIQLKYKSNTGYPLFCFGNVFFQYFFLDWLFHNYFLVIICKANLRSVWKMEDFFIAHVCVLFLQFCSDIQT
jgi:hypothetical protein